MSTMKPPIWERQGRPKPPRCRGDEGVYYMYRWRRAHVYRYPNATPWWVEVGQRWRSFPTFAEAIAYADREARR